METKNYNKLFSGIIIVLVLINISTLVFLWYSYKMRPPLPPPPPPPLAEFDRKPPMLDFMIKELNFDESQGKKLGDILDSHHKSVGDISDSMRILKDAISGEIENAKMDEKKIKSIAKQIGDMQTQIEILRYEHFENIKSICTNGQLELFNGMIKNLMSHPNPDVHPPVEPDKILPPKDKHVAPPPPPK